jgi:hypothetical protein
MFSKSRRNVYILCNGDMKYLGKVDCFYHGKPVLKTTNNFSYAIKQIKMYNEQISDIKDRKHQEYLRVISR